MPQPVVVRGHGRPEAALLLGFDQVPVDRQAYASEAGELADLIADNRLPELAELDEGALAGLLRELRQVGHDVQLAGFTEDQIARLLDVTMDTGPTSNKSIDFRASWGCLGVTYASF